MCHTHTNFLVASILQVDYWLMSIKADLKAARTAITNGEYAEGVIHAERVLDVDPLNYTGYGELKSHYGLIENI